MGLSENDRKTMEHPHDLLVHHHFPHEISLRSLTSAWEVYLVTELCDADLHTVINSDTPLSDLVMTWIGLRENLQETIDFPIKYGAFL